MNLLIDTHILLWHMSGEEKLSNRYAKEVADERNSVFISKASLWEIAIKVSTKKLKLTQPIPELKAYLSTHAFQELDFDYDDLEQLTTLPFDHFDPFDRLIISQAINRNLTVVTNDSKFRLYPIQLL